jgi:DNA-binding LytR/AlgR family response regulator
VEKARQWFGREEASAPTAAEKDDETIFIKVDGEYRQIALQNILYVSGMKDYVMFFLEGERKALITHLTMKSVEDMLPASQFMRVHRSYIIALNKIRSVDRNDCIYIGDEIIRVTDAYREEFSKFLNSKFPGNK